MFGPSLNNARIRKEVAKSFEETLSSSQGKRFHCVFGAQRELRCCH